MRETIRQARDRARMNLVDRFVGYFDPRRGLERLRDRTALALTGGYDGARRDRRATQAWSSVTNNSPDADILGDLPALRERSRALVRNEPIAAGAVGTIVENVVATGLSLQCNPDAATLGMSEDQALEWAEGVERQFEIWANSRDCDIERKQNFYGLQRLAYRSCIESADSFALLPMVPIPGNPFGLRVQIIEGDRVETPRGMREDETRISGGVEKDVNGAPIAYHFLRRHPGSIQGAIREYDRIPAFGELTGRRNVIHLFDQTRPGQSRGVPLFAPVIETLKQVSRYTEAEIMRSVVSAYFAVFVKTETGDGLAQTEEGNPVSADDREKQIGLDGVGQIVDLMPGQDVTFPDTNAPNQGFESFMLAILRHVGAALGLPFEILVKHFTSSYSASRAAMLEAWRFFRGRREFLGVNFCDPIFEAWMEEAVAFDIVNAPGFFADPLMRRAYLQCEWIGDSPGHVDPEKEVRAAVARIEGKLSSRSIETLWLTGKPFRVIQRQLKREEEILRRDGMLPTAEPASPKAAPAAPPQQTNDEQDAQRELDDATR